jgi:hydrogenase maturation protease
MKKSEVRAPKSKVSPKSEVRSPKSKAKTASGARSNVDSGEFSARPRSSDLGPRTSDSAPRTLIVGYGNPLRSDDALGWHASRLLADALVDNDVEVITCHQLTPELAEPLAKCRRAVFIDADVEGKPGEIHRRAVRPQAPASSSFTHTCTPSGLLASAKQLYGHRPQAVVVTVTAQSFEFGDTLSPIVSAALPKVVEMVRKWVGRS